MEPTRERCNLCDTSRPPVLIFVIFWVLFLAIHTSRHFCPCHCFRSPFMSLTVVTSRLLLLHADFVDFYKFLSLSLEFSLSFVLLVVEFLGASCVSKLSKTCAAVKGKILGDMIDRSFKAMSCTMREARGQHSEACGSAGSRTTWQGTDRHTRKWWWRLRGCEAALARTLSQLSSEIRIAIGKDPEQRCQQAISSSTC